MSAHDSHLLGEEIARVAAQIDSAEHTLLTLLRRFDDEHGWSHAGALSCAHWVGWRIGLGKNAA